MIFNYGNIANINTPTHTAVTVGNSTTSLVSKNSKRKYLLLVNDSNETIYVKIGADAVMNEGIRINANGGSYEISPANANLCFEAVNAICSSGSKTLLATEG